jgi:hypothetical protein
VLPVPEPAEGAVRLALASTPSPGP